ncbi:hypothetical protein OC844_002701 [Tilletia horrida]|nr:hypothetical protein OC844_002701 [Tilletia horrida]
MEAKQGDSSSSKPWQSAAAPSDKGKGKTSAEVGLVMTAASIKRRERLKALIQQAKDQLQYDGGSGSAYIKYAGETSAHDDVAARLHQDERAEMPTRFGAGTSVRQSLKSAQNVVSSDEDAIFTIRSLKMVHTAAERTGATAFRESEVAQEMGRALIAVLGFSSPNSAVGGGTIRGTTSRRRRRGQGFATTSKLIQHRLQLAKRIPRSKQGSQHHAQLSHPSCSTA